MLVMAISFGSVCAAHSALLVAIFHNVTPFLWPQLIRPGMHPWFKLGQSPFSRNLELGHREGVSELGGDDSMPCIWSIREGYYAKKKKITKQTGYHEKQQ